MISIEEEFKNFGLLFDKTTQSLSSLPFNFDDCKIKSNDYVTFENFNKTIEKLYYNFIYIYKSCKIANFEIFNSYFYNISSSRFSPFLKSSESNYASVSSNYGPLTGSNCGVLLPYDAEREGNILLFSDKKSVTCCLLDSENIFFKFNTTLIEPISGDIMFENITDIKYDNKETIFIADAFFNNIYKYNIKNLIINENIFQDKLYLADILGGKGELKDNSKFNNIKNICVENNILIVEDYGNKSFKIFDTNFNWLHTSTFLKIFEKIIYFEDICLVNDTLICGKDQLIYKFILKNNMLFFDSIYSVSSYFERDEYIVKIENLAVEKNMLYIVTNKSVKKVWLSTLDYVLGEFRLPVNNTVNKWIAVSPLDKELDAVVLYSKGNGRDNFSFNNDKVQYTTLLNLDNIEVYPLKECYIDKNEYVQSFTILKSLEKVYFNILFLLQNIKYRFFEKKTSAYPIIVEKNYNKNFLGYINGIEFDKDFNIGINEIFQAEVLNRCIRILLELQGTVLKYFVSNISDKEYLSPNPYKNSVAVKNYTYFSDESIILTPNPSRLQIFEELSPGGGILTSLGGAPYTGINGINITEGVNI